ncbi:MAG: tRNA uridine(34) 5-carboxymethylaminomethyl modification radical SAM/GNAT enzyme Elp3 [Candidatus Magasanikbacteria bacterium]|jgi:elongator complex protein 3|nr:tRNA uridine(34) 5-carboxymethylaminomethyl modification radical SAM/GNAT enzyme Elp3 [Candidatus Magasanikbacteria bacterium]MBT4314759.1 tRNA uridine(34) 5-carboxymethylaminomethyl modification radical SAM/GNAT enzyme Elp3 [Candidatus Magasanikbacteria bacterium]MBT4547536.1 tRNA uridine(34) 5-carboxymethylaminomethyl modification radical SAM/GNAT enzyme Elp3 [Candidatus Magasanikbacteria bacterium]MBT6819398.1 tRNA uridine(34) 5-carboxymethylaminomethyl modification radical SAM/GNAT enzyme
MSEFEKIILKIINKKPKSKAEFDDIRRKVCNSLKIPQVSNRNLLQSYQNLVKKKRVKADKQLEFFMRKAGIRTLSGVVIVTSLTKPYACPGKCIYCPSEARMPKSYLSSEPAAARALNLAFDPYQQMVKRIDMLKKSSHPTDKIEYIIKGGSWNFYPLKYQYWFILESFRACNNLTRSKKQKKYPQTSTLKNLQTNLEKEQNYNDKKAKHKIIGLTLETRPDLVTPESIFHMRQMGCTRIELGLQAPDDKILELTKRGHTVQQFKDAMHLLRQAGFKVDLHFMPDLPGSNAKHDVEMYKMLFSDPGFKPDMIKIYPCTVIKSAPLYKWIKAGKYKPYSEKKLFEALIEMKSATPGYCRISRLIRDIPTPDIEAGNMITNLREYLNSEMKKRGLKCECLRCREVGHVSKLASTQISKLIPKLFVDKYETTGGDEYFLSFEDSERQVVFAFLRLRIPYSTSDILNSKLPEIKDSAFIRELHTYGQLLDVGKQDKKSSQHKGMGKKLVLEAEKIAKKNGFEKLAVISGVGVRGYYRKLKYRKQGTYMVKTSQN